MKKSLGLCELLFIAMISMVFFFSFSKNTYGNRFLIQSEGGGSGGPPYTDIIVQEFNTAIPVVNATVQLMSNMVLVYTGHTGVDGSVDISSAVPSPRFYSYLASRGEDYVPLSGSKTFYPDTTTFLELTPATPPDPCAGVTREICNARSANACCADSCCSKCYNVLGQYRGCGLEVPSGQCQALCTP